MLMFKCGLWFRFGNPVFPNFLLSSHKIPVSFLSLCYDFSLSICLVKHTDYQCSMETSSSEDYEMTYTNHMFCGIWNVFMLSMLYSTIQSNRSTKKLTFLWQTLELTASYHMLLSYFLVCYFILLYLLLERHLAWLSSCPTGCPPRENTSGRMSFPFGI